MKHLLALFLAFICIAVVAQAQPTKATVYRDSLTATGVTTAAKNTAGFDTYKYLRTDIFGFREKFLSLKFTKTTDSIKVQGGWVDFGKDTVWIDLWLPVKNWKVAGINTGAGVAMQRDTVLKWITPNYSAWGGTVNVDLTNEHFQIYRICSGLNDTGKVYIGDIRRGGY